MQGIWYYALFELLYLREGIQVKMKVLQIIPTFGVAGGGKSRF